MPKRTRSSHEWLKEHFTDPHVQRARTEGWRSRAVCKLEQMDRKERLLRPGQTVLDLGAAPGGWSQYAVKRVGRTGHERHRPAALAVPELALDMARRALKPAVAR